MADLCPGADRVTLQPIRTGLVPLNAALVGFVEAERRRGEEPTLPPNPYPDTALDWARGTLIQMRADRAWSREPDIAEWLERSRLNPMRGILARLGDPQVPRAARRFTEAVRPGLARLTALAQQASVQPS